MTGTRFLQLVLCLVSCNFAFMKISLLRWATIFSFTALLPVLAEAENWPAWRGAEGLGVTRETKLPETWSAAKNVLWKASLPDRGNSTPIIWSERVFVTQAVDAENWRGLICFDRKTGKQLWKSGLTSKISQETHKTNPYCSASPVTDGTRVIAWYGSDGLYCYDLQGKELWHRDLGSQKHMWGYGSSPVLHENLCVLNFGPGPNAFVIAVDKSTGKTVWQNDVKEPDGKDRLDAFAGDEKGVMGSWSTPLVIAIKGHPELIVSAPSLLQGLDPETGKEFWHCHGLNPLVYTSPVYGEGILVSMGGYFGTSVAVRPGGNADVTSQRLWKVEKSKKNRLGSGVIYQGHIYVANMEGFAECLELETGKSIWQERLKTAGPNSGSWSSMVLSSDKIYLLNQSADTLILRASPKFEILAVNSVGNEMCNASIAISNGDLFIRTHKNLWCISESAKVAQR